jgi:hypothetical protein
MALQSPDGSAGLDRPFPSQAFMTKKPELSIVIISYNT